MRQTRFIPLAFALMVAPILGLGPVGCSKDDDRGVDFVVRNRAGSFFSVQVKATDPTSNPFVKEDKFLASSEFLLCAVRLTEGQLPAIYLARGSDWTQELGHLHYNPHGGASGAYYEMRFAAKYSDALQSNLFENYVETIK